MVPPASHRISRVPRYSGSVLLFSPSLTGLSPSPAALSNALQLSYFQIMTSSTPVVRRQPVWPLPVSLATTKGIEFSFFSSGYLDVSLPRVPLPDLWIQSRMTGHYPSRVPPFGDLRITAYLQLPEAFRSLSRPSSAISAMASTLRSYSLDLAILSHRAPKTIETQFLRFVTFVTIFHCELSLMTLPVQFSRCVEVFSTDFRFSRISYPFCEIPQNDTGTRKRFQSVRQLFADCLSVFPDCLFFRPFLIVPT